jgi:hypothetical protein
LFSTTADAGLLLHSIDRRDGFSEFLTYEDYLGEHLDRLPSLKTSKAFRLLMICPLLDIVRIRFVDNPSRLPLLLVSCLDSQVKDKDLMYLEVGRFLLCLPHLLSTDFSRCT